jgi:glycosyltransferase involved in cell wall biosynthesis
VETIPITYWFSGLGVGDGQDMATRGYLRSLMAVGYEHVLINPRGSQLGFVDELEEFRSLLSYPKACEPNILRVAPGDPRIGEEWKHFEACATAVGGVMVDWDSVIAEGMVDQDYYHDHPEERGAQFTPKPEMLVMHFDPGQLARARDALAREAGGELPIVGITAWEADSLPKALVQQLSDLDMLIVPSVHTGKAFRKSGLDPEVPIKIVPHALPWPVLQDAEATAAASRHSSRYTFYSIGTDIPRKNLRGLIAAYCRAFQHDSSKVGLVIKTSGDTAALEQLYQEGVEQSGVGGLPIALYGARWSDERIRQLHLSGHCWVDATRGEGFGLGQLEAAAMGNPLITTGWGAQTEIIDIGGVMGMRVPYNWQAVPAEMAKIGVYREDQKWADPILDELVDGMRQVALDRWPKSAAQARNIAEHYSPAVVGKALSKALKDAKYDD